MRPPFVYGPENPFYREAFFWDRLRLDRPIIIPGDGNRLMQFVYVNDLVEACFNALEKHTAPGRAFNVADEKPLTQVEVVTEFAKAMGKQAVDRAGAAGDHRAQRRECVWRRRCISGSITTCRRSRRPSGG